MDQWPWLQDQQTLHRLICQGHGARHRQVDSAVPGQSITDLYHGAALTPIWGGGTLPASYLAPCGV